MSTGLTEIISPSDQSHSFTTGRGLKALVPSVYKRREDEMRTALEQYAKEAPLSFRRYERANWVFHGKGIWRSTQEELATIIGSSSFGARCLFVTRNRKLREDFTAELELMRDESPVT